MELIPLAEQISRWRAEYSAGIAEDMADTCKQFLPEFLSPSPSSAAGRKRRIMPKCWRETSSAIAC
jgi:recombinational DNA repair ATPase RecF